jgi:hypothetical protein
VVQIVAERTDLLTPPHRPGPADAEFEDGEVADEEDHRLPDETQMFMGGFLASTDHWALC